MDHVLDEKLMSVGMVASLLACSKSTVWRHCSEGILPKPIKLGHSTRWLQSEIVEHVELAKANRE